MHVDEAEEVDAEGGSNSLRTRAREVLNLPEARRGGRLIRCVATSSGSKTMNMGSLYVH